MAARRKKPDPNIVQRQASDPTTSVWVSASAGTGKTKVLTDRVLRLMLNGAGPENILCVTFTNAAASVMKNRIRDELADWATCSDRVLETKLKKLSGEEPDLETKKRARQLFAEFLESPGEMKIQTIHSFSQNLLRRFPIETGIPPYFDVLDDQTSAELLRDAQAEVLNEIQENPNSDLAKAVHMITPEVSEDDFVPLMGELTYRRGQLYEVFEEHGGLEGTVQNVYETLGVKPGANLKSLIEEICADDGGPLSADFDALYGACNELAEGSDADIARADTILQWLENPGQRAAMLQDYLNVFLTAKHEPRKTLATKKAEGAIETMEAEADRLMRVLEERNRIMTACSTEALLVLGSAILQNYDERKRAHNMLDFDDLIHNANKLMGDEDLTSWVLRKLDGDIEHILVDEAQDTNPEQWQIIASITREFFNGKDGPKKKGRTMFVVGDEKQSIFSFQRADPMEFAKRRQFFAEQVKKAGEKWNDVEMEIAFRSGPAIMTAVDGVFANEEASDGLCFNNETEIKHQPFRQGQGGVVEVHPVVRAEGRSPLRPWSLPISLEGVEEPSLKLAEQIADQIQGWLEDEERMPSRGRPISPADIMILVRRRSAFVDHLVRELKQREVPVAGVDRMSLCDQLAVMDLIAVGEFMLFPRDDLKLAIALKSPLIGLSENQLQEIAIDRKGTFWEALEQRARGKDAKAKAFRNAYEYLSGLMEKMDSRRPYEFYSDILMNNCPANKKSGLLAILGRLGFEAEDPLVEFLNALENYERNHPPTLQGFLAWLEAGQAEVKREVSMDGEDPKVHIMTVHGAKGLEAPIVILPDTTGVPADNTKTRPKLLWPKGDRRVPLWVPRADLECEAFKEARTDAELERDREYRRLMYVAMTRAADRLYVYGSSNKDKINPMSWYSLIKEGLATNSEKEIDYIDENGKKIQLNTPEMAVDQDGTEISLPAAVNDNEGLDITPPSLEDKIIRFFVPQKARPTRDNVKPMKKRKRAGVPVWARTKPKAPQDPVPKFTPSSGGAANDNWSASSPLKAQKEKRAFTIGNLVHELLEFLPPLDPGEREEAARKYLSKPAWKLSEQEQDEITQQVRNVLSDPDFGAIFGPNSRAEVSISGHVEKSGEKQLLSGQIDRLVVNDDTVLIIDYKSNWKIPKDASEIPDMYLVQLGAYRQAMQKIYPGKTVKCALLWTRGAKLQPVPDDLMDKACKDIGLKPVQTAPAPKVG